MSWGLSIVADLDWALMAALLYFIVTSAIPILMLFVVPTNRKPSEATAWLMLIFLFPIAGLLLFLLLGSPRLNRRRRAQQRTLDDLIAAAVREAQQQPELAALLNPPIPPRYEPIVRLSASLGGLPAFACNTVELLPNYDGALQAIADEIDRAERFVHIEYFIIVMDETTEPIFLAMERAVQRGVKVRVLLDHVGSFNYPNFRRMRSRMRAAGIEAHLMLPMRLLSREWNRIDLRNHRKIVVVDGQVGFTGSQNIVDRTYHKRKNLRRGLYYVELVARVTGPVVSQLQALFLTDWYSETNLLLTRDTAPETIATPTPTGDVLCQVLPSGPGYEDENNLKVFTELLHAARSKIVICSPYFVPDEALMIAVTSAAQRGVDVSLLVSEIGDQFLVYHAQRSYYEQLLRAGVKIFLYRAPVLLHSKHMTIDDDIAVIGSSNMDIRSFQLDLEVTLLCFDASVVTKMRAIELEYLRQSRPLLLAEWQARSLVTKLFDNIARLTSQLQ